MKAAGVDVGKRYLDVAVSPGHKVLRIANTPAGIARAVRHLVDAGVQRTLVEATGGQAAMAPTAIRGLIARTIA
ncbi:MAG: hypothetical protein Q4F49_10185, partial [Pseudoxanthomonas suwonensis]|nr:hypothetical protein [Pseudoxanthomonas suwonensis]